MVALHALIGTQADVLMYCCKALLCYSIAIIIGYYYTNLERLLGISRLKNSSRPTLGAPAAVTAATVFGCLHAARAPIRRSSWHPLSPSQASRLPTAAFSL